MCVLLGGGLVDGLIVWGAVRERDETFDRMELYCSACKGQYPLNTNDIVRILMHANYQFVLGASRTHAEEARRSVSSGSRNRQ